jgi:pimeloyl-ACP methyl ester carboxylesterase
LTGRYPAVGAMVVFALVPYLGLSAALQPLSPIIARQLRMSMQAMTLTLGMANAAYAIGTVFAVQFALRLQGLPVSLLSQDRGARAAGLASLRRLDYRLDRSHAEVLPDQIQAQITPIHGNKGLWDRVPELEHPVLVANGAHDVLIHAYASYAMSQRLPNGKIILYSDAGHGFLFQHYRDFAREVAQFLRHEQYPAVE